MGGEDLGDDSRATSGDASRASEHSGPPSLLGIRLHLLDRTHRHASATADPGAP